MSESNEKFDVMFYQMILSFQAAAMQHMGKVMSPLSGKIERNLEAARFNIDLMEMLQRKTDGNLSEEEKKLLDHVLYELRLNYVEESKKPDKTPAAEDGTETESEEAQQATESPDPEDQN